MKKVMFFINTLGGGGAEKVLVDLMKLMPSDKYQFTIISVSGGPHTQSIPDYVEYKQIIDFTNPLLQKLANTFVRHLPYSIFAKLFLRDEYDIEIAYLPGFPTRVLAKKQTKGKKITFLHGKVSKEKIGNLLYNSTDEAYNEYSCFDKVCIVSKDAKNALENTVGALKNSMVVHNIIDVRNAQISAKEPCSENYTTNGLKIISLGRLTKVKGYERLIYAVSKLEKQFDFEIWILGQGEDEQKLRGLIEKLDIHSIKLLGFEANPYKYVAKADLYLCTSYSEGYSTATVEALSLGIPVLTTDCFGMNEILCDGKYGKIVENSEDGIFDGLNQLLSDRELYEKYKKEAMEFAKIDYTQNSIDEYTSLFDSML